MRRLRFAALTILPSIMIGGCGAGDSLPPVEIGAEIESRRAPVAVNIPPRPPSCHSVPLKPLVKGQDMYAAHAWRTGEAQALNVRLDHCGDAWDRMRAGYIGEAVP